MPTDEHIFHFSTEFTPQLNTTGSFFVNLPITLDLTGNWKCAILDILFKSNTLFEQEPVYILASFCETSLLHDKGQLPILGKVILKKGLKRTHFPDPLYIKVKQKQISNFYLDFFNRKIEKFDFSSSYFLDITLHFYKYE